MGCIFIPLDNSLFEFKKGGSKRFYSWLSKKLVLGTDSILKVYTKIKVNGLTANLKLDGSNNESADRLLIKTSNGDITSSQTTYVERPADSEYKLSGSNKKGRWVQFLLENISEPIDSLGIIFRRKTTK